MEKEKELLDKIKQQTEEQVTSFKNEINEAVKKATDGQLTRAQLDEKLNEITENVRKSSDEVIAGLKKALTEQEAAMKAQGEEISKLKENGGKTAKEAPKTLGQLMKEALIEQKATEEYTDDNGNKSIRMNVFKGNTRSYKIELKDAEIFSGRKVAIDMIIPDTMLPGATPGTSIGYLTNYGMQEVTLNLTQDVHLVGVIPSYPTNKTYYGVLAQYTETDGTGVVAENIAASTSSFLLKTLEFKVFDVATIFHVSENQLEDIEGMAARIDRIAPDRILSRIDLKSLQNGGDNSTDIRGMRTSGQYTAFTASTYAGTIEAANMVDCISRMKLQAEIANEMVNAVIMHPSDVTLMQEIKDANDNNITDRRLQFDAAGNLVKVCGLAIIRNKNITADQAIVMWNEACEYGIRKDITMVIGQENDDLSKRMKTILIIARVAFGIAKPSAIIYSSGLAADIVTLKKA